MHQHATPTAPRAPRRRTRALTACLVAGGLALGGGTAFAASSGQAQEDPAATAPAPAEPARVFVVPEGWEAFFAAGYDYDDAVAIAAAWGTDAPIEEVKALAGRALANGEELPVAPGSAEPAAEPVDPEGVFVAPEAWEAFFAAGYDYDDAVAIAAAWGTDAPIGEVKALAGQALLDGETLPVAP